MTRQSNRVVRKIYLDEETQAGHACHLTKSVALQDGFKHVPTSTHDAVGNRKFVVCALMEKQSRQIDHLYIEDTMRNIEALKSRWIVPVLCVLLSGPIRLGELRRIIPTASKKGLTAALRSLEKLRLVTRRDLSSSVLHVEYELASDARDPLLFFLESLAGLPIARRD